MQLEIELEAHEVRKVQSALGEMIDYHHSKGNNQTAKEYREIAEKIKEADQ